MPVAAQTLDTDGGGANDLANPEAVFLPNPMTPDGPAAPFQITKALVENNCDPAKKAAATDHLELLIQNPGTTGLTGFSVCYAIRDADSGAVEASIQFDDGAEPGHFRASPNAIYATSQAATTFAVAVQADRFAPVKSDIAKDRAAPKKPVAARALKQTGWPYKTVSARRSG